MSHLLPGYELGQEVDITFRGAQVMDIGGNFIDVELSDGSELTVLPGAEGVEVTPAGSAQLAELSLASIEQQLGRLTPEESSWVLGRLSVTAPAVLAEALTALAKRRESQTPTVRGGPPLDPATEDEYRRERADYTTEEQA